MQKDFDIWNEKKKLINELETETFYHEREVWWCSLGLNVGQEQDGKNNDFERPVLVLRKFNNRITWVLPITSKEKVGIYYYKLIYSKQNFIVMLSQIRLISSKRFRRKISKVPLEEFSIIKNKVIDLLIKAKPPA